MNVGIRELKAKLSEYVAMAARGESVTITDRGKPVASIVSLQAQSNVARGIEEGWISPPTRSGLGPAVQHPGKSSVLESLDEDRGLVTLYVDSSALLKRYVQEHDSDLAVQMMQTDPVLVTSKLSTIEVRRNLARLLDGNAQIAAKSQFSSEIEAFGLVSVDDATCSDAAAIAEETLCRSLDAIHLASARRTGSNTTVLTFDVRQAQAARALGMAVVGT